MKNDPKQMREWLDKLIESDKLIIVEGLNDKKALNAIGVPLFRVKNLDTELYLFAEKIAEELITNSPNKKTKQVIILTDRDVEGKKIYKKLKTFLTDNGVQIDNYFREFLFKNSDASHIEGIDSFFENKIII